MPKIFIALVCLLAFSAANASAKQKARQTAATDANAKYGGNPSAGGGTTGSSQATNSPNASNEIGGGK